jgi:hypothetical protein
MSPTHASRCSWPARFGKSLAAAREVIAWLAIPGTRGWIVAPSYRLGEKEFRYLAADARTLFHDAATVTSGGLHGPSSIVVEDGGEAHVLSAVHPEGLLGEELDWLIISEASRIHGDVWPRFLRARLATRLGVAVMPSTPAGFNWMHGAFLRGHDGDAPDWASFQYRTEDNPLIPAAEIEEARASLPVHTFAEQYGGEFTQPDGSVFADFDPAIHVIDRRALDRMVATANRPVGHYVGIDFGYSAPMAMLRGMLIGDLLVVVDEFYETGKQAHEEARPFCLRAAPATVLRAYCDPSGKSQIDALRSAPSSVPAEKANNHVAWGISLVRARLQPGIDGKPRLLVLSTCVNLIREFTTYGWGPGRSRGEPIPAKGQSDHAMDALRYLCAGLNSGRIEQFNLK